MRKITEQSVQAFYNNETFSSSNTVVKLDDNDFIAMYLHGNKIAINTPDGVLVGFGGYEVSNTTKERLNGVLENIGSKVSTKKGVTYITTPHGTIEVDNLNNFYSIRK